MEEAGHRAGYGGVIRDDTSGWTIVFSGFLGSSSILFAELKAIEVSLSLAWDKGIRNLLCHSDSQFTVNLVRNGMTKFHRYVGVMANIQRLLSLEWIAMLKHTLRECNFSADGLAKRGCSEQVQIRLESFPYLGFFPCC